MLSFLVLPLRRIFLLLFYFYKHGWSVASDYLWPYVAHQAPLPMGFSKQEYWSGLPCPPPGNLPDPGIKPLSPASPALQADSSPLSHWGCRYFTFKYCKHWLLVSERNFKSYHCCCSVTKLCPIIQTPYGSAGKEFTCDAGHLGSIPGLGRPPGEGRVYPFQYSGLENSMDCIVHGVTKSRTRPSDLLHILNRMDCSMPGLPVPRHLPEFV